MGAGLYADASVYREAIDECARLLEPHLGLDIRTTIEGTRSGINETWLAQPALFMCEYALAQLWMSWGVKPAAMIGHSVGEYVAAHLAGVLTLADALALVAERGRIMQAMAPGAMAAVHASRGRVEPLVRDLVEIAAVNAPSLCAIAGQKTHIAEALQRLGQAGIEVAGAQDLACLPLRHDGAGAAGVPPGARGRQAFGARHSLHLERHRHLDHRRGSDVARATGVAIFVGPWSLQRALRRSPRTRRAVFLEVGPGVALSTIARMSLPKSRQSATLSSLPRPGDDVADRASMLEAVGRLWVSGVTFNWPAMHAGAEPRRIPLPTYPFERQRLVIEPPTPSEAPKSGPLLPALREPSTTSFTRRPGPWMPRLRPRRVRIEKAHGSSFAITQKARSLTRSLASWAPAVPRRWSTIGRCRLACWKRYFASARLASPVRLSSLLTSRPTQPKHSSTT